MQASQSSKDNAAPTSTVASMAILSMVSATAMTDISGFSEAANLAEPTKLTTVLFVSA
jgi:hypothetical protein